MNRIAEAACGPAAASSVTPPLVIEIGPGKGALTEALLDRAPRVAAIEVDGVLVHYLHQKFRSEVSAGRLNIIEGDVLKTDWRAMAAQPVITGNLPYYITSPILERVFSLGPGNWTRAVFLVQAEVAARLTAVPGTRDMGYLSVLAQAHAQVETLFEVPRDAFRPPPKVESAVVRLTPRSDFGVDLGPFLKFAQACFRHKRKTLRNNLIEVFAPEKLKGLPEAKQRAEQLSVAELAALYRKLSV